MLHQASSKVLTVKNPTKTAQTREPMVQFNKYGAKSAEIIIRHRGKLPRKEHDHEHEYENEHKNEYKYEITMFGGC
jgi:hypothetical protein